MSDMGEFKDRLEGTDEVWRHLAPHWTVIEAAFGEDNARLNRLMGHDHDALGRVLKCHLVVEHYMDLLLEERFSFDDFEGARLSFYQKIKLLPKAESGVIMVRPGIVELNKIRNQFGHDLDVDLSNLATPCIDSMLGVARRGVTFSGPLERIEEFTMIACTFLMARPEISKIFKEALRFIKIVKR